MKKNKVELIAGEGKIAGRARDGRRRAEVTGKNLLIATGGRPRLIPGFEHDEQQVLSSTGAILLEKLPKSMTILGGGVIGMEFAHVLNAFGVEVHVVELMEQILPLEDAESGEGAGLAPGQRGGEDPSPARRRFLQKRQGLGHPHRGGQGRAGEKIEAEKLLVAVAAPPTPRPSGWRRSA